MEKAMPPAIIAGVIAAGATAGGAILSSKSNNKAVKAATQQQQQSDAAQIAYQRESDARNTANLSPWMARGNAAGDTVMAALGLGGSVTAPQGSQPPGALTVPYSGAYPDASAYPGYQGGALGSPQGPNATTGPATAQQAALNAYEMFKQSTGYQSRLQEGQRGQGAMFSALGTYQSGARDKALARFNQDYASREFGTWLGQVGNQQGLGFGAASALAGVSQGSADRLGAISQNSADFAGQAAVARAQNQGALYTGIAGAAGQVAGALSSYRQPAAYNNPALARTVPAYGYG
jgi:hypothetical protein